MGRGPKADADFADVNPKRILGRAAKTTRAHTKETKGDEGMRRVQEEEDQV